MIINLTGASIRLYGPDAPDTLTDPMTILGVAIAAAEPPADFYMIDLGSIGDEQYRGHPVHLVLAEIHVRDLPEARPGTRYVVSAAVALASRGRSDLLVPLGEVRTPAGALLGHKVLISPC
ncbi:hypothetical protein [Streptomyces goshikiensis]